MLLFLSFSDSADAEVNWENVRCLPDGETVSISGTHLGHNLPDSKGSRYCINLVSIAGRPEGNDLSDI
jgi:peptide methionine sulfoxide reductase MsrB